MLTALQSPVRVAITGVSGDVGLGALKGIKQGLRNVWVLGIDAGADCAGFRFADAAMRLPLVADPTYVDALIDALKQHRIQLLIPGVDPEVVILARERERIEACSGCRVLVADRTFVECCSDKLRTAQWLESLNLPAPCTWDPDALSDAKIRRLPRPLVAKPRKGSASKGVRTLHSQEDLDDFVAERPDGYCLQAFIEGLEYTCGLLFDKDGVLRDWICMERTLFGGRTVRATTAVVDSIEELIAGFAARVSVTGPINLQLRIGSDGVPYVFEINPRLSGSTAMRVAVGFNDPARIVNHWIFGESLCRARVSDATVYSHSTQLVIRKPARLGQRERPQSLVFDCGDTLLELVPAREMICRDVLGEFGIDASLAEIRRAYGLVDFSLKQNASQLRDRSAKQDFYKRFNAMLASALGIESQEDCFNVAMQEAFAAHGHWTAGTETVDFLQHVHRHYACYVLANWDSSLPEVLEYAGIHDFFDGIYSSWALGAEKPKIEIFRRFRKASGVDPSTAIYIGNEYVADVVGSRRAGFRPILLDRYGDSPEQIDCDRVRCWSDLDWLVSSDDGTR